MGSRWVYHYEADQFWISPSGEYHWNPERLGEAHKWCRDQAAVAMCDGVCDVIVSNTFIKRKDLQPYLDLAKDYNYAVQEIICRGEWENVHNVPQDKVEKCRRELEL